METRSRRQGTKSRQAHPNEEVEKLRDRIRSITIHNVETLANVRLPKRKKSLRDEFEEMKRNQEIQDELERREVMALRERERVAENLGANSSYSTDLKNMKETTCLYPIDQQVEVVVTPDIEVKHKRKPETMHRQQSRKCSYSAVNIDAMEVPPLIDARGKAAQFNLKSFKSALSSLFRGKQSTEEELLEPNIRSSKEREVIEKAELVVISPGHSVEQIETFVYRMPIVQAVLNSNIEEFFKIIFSQWKKECSNSVCGCSCFCHSKGKFSMRYTYTTVLHLAAAHSTAEFVKNVIDQQSFTPVLMELTRRGCSREDSNKFVNHYREAVQIWEGNNTDVDIMLPVDVAAEQNRIDIVQLFMDSQGTMLILNNLVRYPHMPKMSCYDAYNNSYNPSLLSRLIENSIFLQLSDEHRQRIIHSAKESQLRYAVNLALAKGDTEIAKELYAFFESSSVYDQRIYSHCIKEGRVEHILPGKVHCSGSLLCGELPAPPPAAHILAQYGHYEKFNDLSIEQKRVIDFHNITALIHMLQFTDDQVRAQLKCFRNVQRENIFLFLSEIIVKNRIGLLDEVLQIGLSNPDNFTYIPTEGDVYQHYGLPVYVALPMETALERTENMLIIEKIAKIYSKQERFTRKLQEEDALRCIIFIQSRATRYTEHLRLAVILMMLKFADPFSRKYLRLLNSPTYHDDNVSRYLLQKYSEQRSVRFLPKVAFVPWSTAINVARDAVASWGGSLEEADFCGTFLSESKSTKRPDILLNREVRSIMMTEEKKKAKRQNQAKLPKNTLIMLSKLEKAIKEFENLN